MHPVFGEVIQILESDVPETEDYLFAAELCAVLPDACHVENAHRDRINSIFNNDLDSNVAVQCIAGKFDTMGLAKKRGQTSSTRTIKAKVIQIFTCKILGISYNIGGSTVVHTCRLQNRSRPSPSLIFALHTRATVCMVSSVCIDRVGRITERELS